MTQPPSGPTGYPSRPGTTAGDLPQPDPRTQFAGDGFGQPSFNGSPAPVQGGQAPDNRTQAGAQPRPATGNTGAGGTKASAARAAANRARGPRRARLQLRHIDPWTVLKFSCVLAIALFFIWLITVAVLFGVLEASGVIGSINDTVVKINGSGSSAPITAIRVLEGAAVIGALNIILFIALSTIGALVYNLCADLVGGVEVTFSESEG